MSVTVRIPTILRPYTDNKSTVELAVSGNLTDVLTALESAAPGISARVLDDAGIVVCRKHDHWKAWELLRNLCEQAQATGFRQLDVHQHQVDFGMLLQLAPE